MYKLSEIKGEKALDVIVEIAGPIANIATDKQLKGLFANGSASSNVDKVARFILKNHREDTVAILAALSLETPSEYIDGLSLTQLLGDVYKALTDEELLAFLPSQGAEYGFTLDGILEG